MGELVHDYNYYSYIQLHCTSCFVIECLAKAAFVNRKCSGNSVSAFSVFVSFKKNLAQKSALWLSRCNIKVYIAT